jgi:hypothetical protein
LARPLIAADPFGGVIVTDWYSLPGNLGERYRVSVFILSQQLRADAVRASVFRQIYRSGHWVDAPVDPAVAADLQNKVTEQARALQVTDPA